MSRIAVIGSVNMDLVVHVPRFPTPGETILGASFSQSPGGKGANQAVAIGRLGGDVQFVGAAGWDSYGEILRNKLQAAHVNVDHLEIDPDGAPTGIAFITVDSHGENTIAVASGANLTITPNQVSQALEKIKPDIVLAQLEIPLEAVQAAASFGATFILNPAPAQKLPDDLIAKCDVITPNETEAELLTGETDYRTAAKCLLDRGAKAVLITLGSKGCYYRDATEEFTHPAMTVQTVDTTAAGDAFNGALANFWNEGIREAIRKATIVAALSTTKSGAQDSMPTTVELNKLV